MAVMQSRSERAERLLVAVETSCGSGDYRVDPRLRVEEVWQRSDDSVSRAVLSVMLDDVMDSEEVRRLYHPDRRLLISTEDADPWRREFLFEGYPLVQTSRWDGRVDHDNEQYVFEAEHVWERFSRTDGAWVYGRRMRSGTIEDGLAIKSAEYRDKSEHFTALPCIFNPDGSGNRAIEPLVVTDFSGEERPIHVFAPDGVPAAKWTFATALRYLVWFHLPRSSNIFDGNVFNTTSAIAAGVPGPGDPLRDALEREPVSLVCEATNLVEALALLGAAAGIHITAETANSEGRPRTQLRVWSPRAGALRKLHLVRGGRHWDGTPRYDAASKSACEVLRDNNTYRGHVTWDHRPITNRAVVIGDVKRYEVTVPLWPGWLPVNGLDNVSETNRQTCKMAALTPEDVRGLGDQVINNDWYRRYHCDGDLYHQHADVARLWVLNEDGRCDAMTYNRNVPFDSYAPFDFASVLPASETRIGHWTRRPRPLGMALSVGADGRSPGVWVEVSFDSGMSWHSVAGPISVLKDRAGIHFDGDNPTQVSPPGIEASTQNMWYALVDQTFRVRVTAVIESDDRLMAAYGPAGLDSPTVQVNTLVVRKPQAFKFASRSLGGSVLYPGLTGGTGERDDSLAMLSLARWLAQTRQDRQVQVSPAIPWLETGYVIGDRITEIAGRCLEFATTIGVETQYPSILERRFVLRNGLYETLLTLGAMELPMGVV